MEVALRLSLPERDYLCLSSTLSLRSHHRVWPQFQLGPIIKRRKEDDTHNILASSSFFSHSANYSPGHFTQTKGYFDKEDEEDDPFFFIGKVRRKEMKRKEAKRI